jgi:pimeloyl-ACP methyl ester carboxylesterase
MTARDFEVALPDGRTVTAREDGDPSGVPVFSLHGTPGCRFLYPRHVQDAARRGIRLIGYDRPGYGGSTPQRGRSVGDTAGDVSAIADHLGFDSFAVWGHSGGGAPALACAARLPERVVGASCLAGVAAADATGFDPLEGMGDANREDYRLMASDPTAWEAKLVAESAGYRTATPEQIGEVLATLLSEVDRKVLNPAMLQFFAEQSREGFRNGADGMRDDNLGDIRPWGFDLAEIRVPTQIWHGGHDRFVPFSHGRWLAAQVPNAESHLLPDEGHLTLYEHRIPEVHGWLAEQF